MRIEIQLRIVGDDDSVISVDKVLHLDKSDDRLEAVGLSLGEAKAALAGIQERVVTAQAASFLDRHRCCSSAVGPAEQGTGPDPVPYRLWHHPAEQSALSPLPLPAYGEQDLQPAGLAVHRAHRSGTAVPGDPLGLAGLLRPDSRVAEGRSADRQHRQCLHHSPPPAQGRRPPRR